MLKSTKKRSRLNTPESGQELRRARIVLAKSTPTPQDAHRFRNLQQIAVAIATVMAERGWCRELSGEQIDQVAAQLVEQHDSLVCVGTNLLPR